MQPALDARPMIRVFLAASQDLATERRHFEEMIRRIGQRPQVARRYRLEPTHWQQGGGDAGGKTLQERIFEAMRFDTIHIVVVLIGSYVGPGTLAEYEAAKALRAQQGSWPKLLVFFKCAANGIDLVGDETVRTFHRLVVDEGHAVPTNFRDLAELETRLGSQIEALLSPVPRRPDPIGGEGLRRLFFLAGSLSTALTAALLFVTQTMTFPVAGTSSARVLFVLVGPPLLFVVGMVATWALSRLIREFRFAWHSDEYADDRIYRVYRNLLPRSVIPNPLRQRFPNDSMGEVLTWAMLIVVCFAPMAAQYNCVFRELLSWDFVVAPDDLAQDSTPPDRSTAALPVRSRLVERGPLRWPYTAATPEIADAVSRGETLFVYSPLGTLGDPNHITFGTPQAHRMNMGPEVFLPVQPLLYIVMMCLQGLLAAGVLVQLTRLRWTVTQPLPGLGASPQEAEAMASIDVVHGPDLRLRQRVETDRIVVNDDVVDP